MADTTPDLAGYDLVDAVSGASSLPLGMSPQIDIRGMDIEQMNPIEAEIGQDALYQRPVLIELIALLLNSLVDHVRREFRRLVQPRAAEIKNVRWLDDGHFDGEEFIVEVERAGDIASVNAVDSQLRQPFVSHSLAPVATDVNAGTWVSPIPRSENVGVSNFNSPIPIPQFPYPCPSVKSVVKNRLATDL